MQISLIVAMAANRVIGVNNQLPWHLPADLKHFKQITMGKPILMGRKTYESIGKPLPGRRNIILTHDKNFQAPGCVVAYTLEEAIAAAENSPEIMVIGGASLFARLLSQAQRFYMTLIHQDIPGDTFFPVWNKQEWHEIKREDHQADANNPYAYSFLWLERINNI